MKTNNQHMLISIARFLAALMLASSLAGCDKASMTPRVSRTVGDVEGFDLILDESAIPVEFGQFSVGYAKKSNYLYFTYRGQLYVSVGGGSVLIRPLTNSPAKYVVRETVLEGKERGETTRSLLQILDRESGAELARRGLVARQIEDGTGWTGDHAAKFVRTVLSSSALPARHYPDAASYLDLRLTPSAQPYPSSSAVGPCSLEARIERTSHGQVLVTPSFKFWPNAPIRFVACDSGSIVIASGVYAANLYLDLLSMDGTPTAQGHVRLPLPVESIWANMEDVRIQGSSIELTILANQGGRDFKQSAYGRVSVKARLQPSVACVAPCAK